MGIQPGQITAGYRWYLQYGCLTLSRAQQTEHDEVCRRTAYKDRLGLTLEYDTERLKSLAVDFHAMTPEARIAWSHAATDQEELPLAA